MLHVQVLDKNDFRVHGIWGVLQIFGLCTHFGRVYFRFSARAARRKFFWVVFINTGGVVYVCEMTCVIYLPHIVLGIGLRVGLLHGDVAAAPGWQARRARSARGERADCRRGPFEVGEVAHNDILLVHVIWRMMPRMRCK